MKQFSAIIAAIIITGIVGTAMVIVGGNALTNKNTVPMLNAQAGASTNSQTLVTATQNSAQTQAQADTQTLANAQSEITQLQDSLNQYQTRLNQAVSQLNQDNAQLAQYQTEFKQVQTLLQQLQNLGLITISNDGQIYIGGGSNR